MELTEDRIIEWLRRQPGASTLLGDDAALVAAGGPWAVTVDSQRGGIHFPPDLDPAVFARRLLAVAISDLAASGAAPRYAFLALAAPGTFGYRRFFRALLVDCRRYPLELAGGDLSRSAQPEATLTVLGDRPRRGRWLTRTAARTGDALWLGGTLGESALGCRLVELGARINGGVVVLPELGLDVAMRRVARRAVRRHLLPTAQLELGQWLGRRRRTVAAIDVSDGLALDAGRLCRASGRGCVIDEASLPSPEGFGSLATFLDLSISDLLLGGGEDYVLLFSLAPGIMPDQRFDCRRIGTVTADRRLRLRAPDGSSRALPRLGWDHFRSGSRSHSQRPVH